jgi:quercetin dioxygenase-like cupin family protein
MKKGQYPVRAITLPAVWLLCTTIVHAQQPTKPTAALHKSHIMLTPEEIEWGECPPEIPPGAKCAVIEGDPKVANALHAIRAKMPDNYKIPPHFHPADEHLVVLSGVFNMGLGDKLDEGGGRAMTAGSFMVMPKGVHHFAWTKGETVLQIYAVGPLDFTYVNPQDDPRKR